jgi:hypothetical protein
MIEVIEAYSPKKLREWRREKAKLHCMVVRHKLNVKLLNDRIDILRSKINKMLEMVGRTR